MACEVMDALFDGTNCEKLLVDFEAELWQEVEKTEASGGLRHFC